MIIIGLTIRITQWINLDIKAAVGMAAADTHARSTLIGIVDVYINLSSAYISNIRADLYFKSSPDFYNIVCTGSVSQL